MAKRGVTGFWFVAPFFVRALSRKVVMRGKGELAVFFFSAPILESEL